MVRSKSPGSRSSSSPGRQSDPDGTAVAVGSAALDVDLVRVDVKVEDAVVDRVSQGGGVVGSVSVELAGGGPTASVDEACTVEVVSSVCVS